MMMFALNPEAIGVVGLACFAFCLVVAFLAAVEKAVEVFRKWRS